MAKASPPMTARPSGAFCSPPSPSPSAMGTIPTTMASAVMSTGRRRVAAASRAASCGAAPPATSSLAKATTRMPLAVATPMLMMAPMKAGTESVSPQAKSAHATPASATGSALAMMSGSVHDWKLITMMRYTSTTASRRPAASPS